MKAIAYILTAVFIIIFIDLTNDIWRSFDVINKNRPVLGALRGAHEEIIRVLAILYLIKRKFLRHISVYFVGGLFLVVEMIFHFCFLEYTTISTVISILIKLSVHIFAFQISVFYALRRKYFIFMLNTTIHGLTNYLIYSQNLFSEEAWALTMGLVLLAANWLYARNHISEIFLNIPPRQLA